MLEVDVPRALSPARADVTRLTQVVANLLTNAAKYTEPGGRINVTAGPTATGSSCACRTPASASRARCSPSVFDMFTQGRQALDRAHGGLGLGLTIVKQPRRAARRHRSRRAATGSARAASSSSACRPPATRYSRERAEQSRPGRSSSLTRTGRRILVVDDNVDAARLMADALEAVGHETRVAFDGPAALEVVRSFAPDAALLDLGLPLMDGYELAEQLIAQRDGRRPLLDRGDGLRAALRSRAHQRRRVPGPRREAGRLPAPERAAGSVVCRGACALT